MLVRTLIERQVNGERLLSGQVAEVPDDLAASWIAGGLAELVAPDSEPEDKGDDEDPVEESEEPVAEERVTKDVATLPVETAAIKPTRGSGGTKRPPKPKPAGSNE